MTIMTQTFQINKLCVIGVGLIGGSVAQVLRKHECVKTITGGGRNIESLKKAQSLGVIDDYDTDLGKAVEGADVILVAVPLGNMATVFQAIKSHVSENTIITDVGSTKQSVIDTVQSVFGELPGRFIPGHPIAGTEQSGVEASFPELFEGRRVILTPHEKTDQTALEAITQMWQVCGAEVINMQPAHHDEVLAATSHLPHMLAYALVDTLARMDDSQEIFDYAAGGFRDFTRIASSDPDMWHDICLANQEKLVKVLIAFSEDLQRLTAAVEKGDSTFLKETFTRAKQARDEFCGKSK